MRIYNYVIKVYNYSNDILLSSGNPLTINRWVTHIHKCWKIPLDKVETFWSFIDE
jgi:hypothetical protein